MALIKRFQVRSIPGEVSRMEFSGRSLDYWAPQGGSQRLLIAHDGQNIFDPATATRRQTWKLAQSAIRVSKELGVKPPLIIAIFHSSNKADPWGRLKDLTPEDGFREGIRPANPDKSISIKDLRGNAYLEQIFTEILPEVMQLSSSQVSAADTAMIGSSMGGLATLYAANKYKNEFHTALAFSPHWVLAGEPLVDYLIKSLPASPERKLWMSRGTKGLDASYKPFQERADRLAEQMGWSSNFKSKTYHRSGHNERSWAKHLDDALKFWLRDSIDSN